MDGMSDRIIGKEHIVGFYAGIDNDKKRRWNGNKAENKYPGMREKYGK